MRKPAGGIIHAGKKQPHKPRQQEKIHCAAQGGKYTQEQPLLSAPGPHTQRKQHQPYAHTQQYVGRRRYDTAPPSAQCEQQVVKQSDNAAGGKGRQYLAQLVINIYLHQRKMRLSSPPCLA